MIRHQYSYWLTAEPASPVPSGEAGRLLRALKNEGLLIPEGSLEASLEGNGISAEVDPRRGTCERDDGIREAVAGIAQSFPDFTFELRELDEEDRSCQVFSRWEDGLVAVRRRSRLVPASREYGGWTVKRVLSCLEAAGADSALIDTLRGAFAGDGR